MALLWYFVVLGIVLTISKPSLGITYNLEVETHKSFSCYTTIFKDDELNRKAIKLLLDHRELSITCHLFDKHEEDSNQNKRKNLVLYTSAGLAPTIEIFNSTYSNVFYFKMALEEDKFTWALTLPRQDIAHNTNIAPIEQWYVKFNMHHGFNMFTTRGTLLDIAREPILQWGFSAPCNITTLIPDVKDIKLTKSPCASDVVIIGLIMKDNITGITLGVTWSGFTIQDTVWYNMTSTICAVADYDCSDLALLDVILTNAHLVFLTNLGLFISENLCYGQEFELKFYKPNFCGFEMDDYMRARIWYNVQCLANQENYEEDYISLSFAKDKTLSQESTCFYSNAPFKEWYSCLPRGKKNEKLISRRMVSFLIDYQQNTGVGVLTRQAKTLVTVNKLTDHKLNKRRKFPSFFFQDAHFRASGMFFHPNSHFLYVYGNQVWFSEDGGNSFNMLIKLVGETVVKTDACVYTQAIIFVTDRGSVFYTKAGLLSYAKLTDIHLDIFNMNFDHLGILYCIALNETAFDFIRTSTMNVNVLLQEDDLAFDGALSPQYLTEEQIMFFSHISLDSHTDPQPRFYNMYIGKALEYGIGGAGIINKVFERTYSPNFLSSVIVDVLDRFPIETSARSPCVLNSLTILSPDPGTTAFKLQLGTSATQIFQASDIEKTVVIPGFSSFLIIAVSDLNASAHATMPQRVPVNTVFQSKQWFLYDFGTKNGRKWKVVVDRCRYTVQQLDDLPTYAIKYMDLGSTRNFSFRVTPVNVAYHVFQMHLMNVIVGKPTLLDIYTNSYWDDTDSYIIQLRVQSRFFDQGKSSVAVIVPQASLVCDVTTLILTLKNSCSYLKVMHYTLPVPLSGSDWLSHKKNTSKHLKNLPVNYRPPSRLGIAVPITENFYNADPEKPRLRNYFKESKSSGTYKQCANKTRRSQCGCTDNMKLSFFVTFSDCKEKAIRMKYPVLKLPLSFTVENENGSVVLSSPYFLTITEVNNRTNWEISDTNRTPSLLKMRTYMADKLDKTLYNPDGLALTIYGSELFHFRVKIIPGISFCCLFAEFQIYVDDAPVGFPGQILMRSITAVLVGFVMFVTFVLEAYEIKIWSVLRDKLKRKISRITFSTVSTGSSEN